MTFVPLAITGLGAITAVGDDVDQTCASVRAGLMGFGEHASYAPIPPDPPGDDERGLLCARVQSVDPDLDGPARLVELAAAALANLVENAEIHPADLRDAALLVSLPAPDRAVATWDLDRAFLPALSRRASLSFGKTITVQVGPCGMIELLAEASRLIASRAVPRCVILGADSYLTSDRLKVLDEAYRIKSPRNVDGFIPGEAATAVLLETLARTEARGVVADGVVQGVGVGEEPETITSEKQSTGAGLSAALRAIPGSGARWMLCDLNGESYRHIEWGVAAVRLGDAVASVEKLLHPANCWGDIGAATGGALMAVAASGFRRSWAPGDEAIVWSGSDGARRAAARIERA